MCVSLNYVFLSILDWDFYGRITQVLLSAGYFPWNVHPFERGHCGRPWVSSNIGKCLTGEVKVQYHYRFYEIERYHFVHYLSQVINSTCWMKGRWDFFPLQKLWNILWDDWALAQLNFIVCGHVWICSPEVAITRFPVTLSIPFSVWLLDYPCQNHLECLMKMQIPGPASCI